MTRFIDMLTEDNASIEITMTNEQYLKQCDIIADGAMNDAARSLWEIVKSEVVDHWFKMDELAEHDCENARRQRRAKFYNMHKRLDAYKVAFSVLGCTLEVEDGLPDYADLEKIEIRRVALSEGECSLGSVVNW